MTAETEVTQTETTRTTTARVQPAPSMLSNTLAIVGFIILIVILIWGLVHFASLSQPWFSSLFNKKAASLVVSAPSSATSSIPFTVSWKYTTTEKGTYAFLYQCKSGFHFEIPNAGGTMNSLPCGAGVTVPSTTSLSVTPVLSGSAQVSVPLSIIFIPSATSSTSSGQASSKQAQGNATVVIKAGTATELPQAVITNPTPATPSKPATPAKPQAPVYRGPADISVRIIAVNVDASGGGIATFDIANVGGSSSGSYTFTAQLPTQSGYLYSSPIQYSLAPGDHIINTLNFSQAVSGTFSVSVNASDANQGNNYVSQSVSMPYYYYNNYYPYNYPQQYQYPYAY